MIVSVQDILFSYLGLAHTLHTAKAKDTLWTYMLASLAIHC